MENKYESNNIGMILFHSSREDIMKVALYCIEDCIHLTTKQDLKNYVELLKRYKILPLDNLRVIENKAYDYAIKLLSINPISYFIAMAISCAASIPNCEEEVILEYIIEVAESSYCVFPKEQRESKREEYLSYARMFLHEKEHNPIPNTPKLDSEYNIALFLDQLEDHNIFVHENFELKLPKGYQIKGEDKLDLVKKIAGSRFAIDYLNYLYIKDA